MNVLRSYALWFVTGVVVGAKAGVVIAAMAGEGQADSANPTDSVGGLRFESVVPDSHGVFTLRGRDERHQILVTSVDEAGMLQDRTGTVSYQVVPEGILRVDSSGLVTPLGNGQATITAVGPDGRTATTTLTVVDFQNAPLVNFAHQVVPIFTKSGCNSGGCHGKSGGQNGFSLSLLGFEPQEDYEYLVKQGRGRRLFPAAPDNSLLLQKATNTTPHGGGLRIAPDSHDYRVLRRWIAQGMPYGSQDDPTISRIEVFPKFRVMAGGSDQQICVIAHYSDGNIVDVTRAAQYTVPEKEMAQVNATGQLTVSKTPGDVVAMVRYASQVGVYRAMVPLGAPVEELPVPKNFIDEHVLRKLKQLGLPPSPACDDATFIRRVTLDLAGRLPTTDETVSFLDNTDLDKREELVDRLLDGTGYADFFANKWSAILRNKRRSEQHKHGTFAFHDWIRRSLYENKPYDQFVREIVTASGPISQNPPVAWYREVTDRDVFKAATVRMEDVSQLFLGVRMQCAQCHHHPFEKWSQDDYYGLTAFFERVQSKPGDELREIQIFHKRGAAGAENPKTKVTLKPTALDAEPMDLPPETDPRHALVNWMVQEDNPFFAHALVNRYWKHFFNRGLVHPEDDLRETNPPSNPDLLEALASGFIDSGYDLKALIRLICQSQTYQLASTTNEHNATDRKNFSRYYPRRLNAEVLLDAIDTVTDSSSEFPGLHKKARAIQIPDSGERVKVPFLNLFGRPEGASACECERTSVANLSQSLHLLNSPEIQGKLANGRAKSLAEDTERSPEEKIRQLYLLAFSREPTAVEITRGMEHLKKHDKDAKQGAYEDILWALVNTKEFMFNH